MSNLIAKPGQVVKLRYTSPFRDEALFPRARVLDADSGDIVKTVDLSANANIAHVYENDYTVESDEGVYWVQYTPFTNSGHTTIAENESEAQDTLTVQTIAKAQPTALGGVIITEEDIRLIAKHTAEILKNDINIGLKGIKIPQVKFDEKKILNAIKNNKVVIPETPDLDLTPVTNKLTKLENLVVKQDNKEIKGLVSNLIQVISGLNVTQLNQEFKNLITEVQGLQAGLNDIDVFTLQAQVMKLLKELIQHKEILFTMDDLQRRRIGKLVEAIQKLPFGQNIAIQGAMEKLKIGMMDEQ